MSELTGKTIFITGASCGIGHAIGMRCATAGANVVIAAKENPNQDFSIYIAADQMIKAGGKALAIDVDVSNDDATKLAVNKAADQFGGIDILINNVSAFCFTDTVNTPPEKFDLLFSINVRATFLMSQLCIPYLKQATNPHIINISPPLDMDSRWFKNHLAFTMSKYGMSMCTLGMAAEFQQDGVAVNSLWPLTTIATTTIKDHFVPEVYLGSRWPTIMADAAFVLMQRNARECTEQFFIDEALLREAGVTDFTHYAVDSSVPLIQDLFVPEESMNLNSAGVPLAKNLFA
jgi:citronellol/citronellal dehydrogenase